MEADGRAVAPSVVQRKLRSLIGLSKQTHPLTWSLSCPQADYSNRDCRGYEGCSVHRRILNDEDGSFAKQKWWPFLCNYHLVAKKAAKFVA